MSWLFSRALVEEFLPGQCLGGEACAKVCDMLDAHPATKWPDDCAAAIRARGEK